MVSNPIKDSCDKCLLGKQCAPQDRVQDRADLVGESTEWLLSRYRFPKNVLLDLCRDLGPMLDRETNRTKAIPVHIQLLFTLEFLATGTFQREVGDICGISQPSMSRIMSAVLDAIISLALTYIQFPYRNPLQAEIKWGFHAIARFPNIIGAIDCTHIAIIKFVGYNMFKMLLQGYAQLLKTISLLGDQCYPLKPWLMIPLTTPRTEQEQVYNHAHARSRGTVERAIGLLKGRWLCLSSTEGTLQYRPEKVCKIVMACSVLHNLARQRIIQTLGKSGHWPNSETLQRFIRARAPMV
uniref:Putative nuclease HARBI1 n=1 Tax=Sinocyclocheilus rhinocerous TaxID=307959 RepID=A0A673HA42_9TELE